MNMTAAVMAANRRRDEEEARLQQIRINNEIKACNQKYVPGDCDTYCINVERIAEREISYWESIYTFRKVNTCTNESWTGKTKGMSSVGLGSIALSVFAFAVVALIVVTVADRYYRVMSLKVKEILLNLK